MIMNESLLRIPFSNPITIRLVHALNKSKLIFRESIESLDSLASIDTMKAQCNPFGITFACILHVQEVEDEINCNSIYFHIDSIEIPSLRNQGSDHASPEQGIRFSL